MYISTKSRLAVGALVRLAMSGAKGSVTLRELSREQRVSASYMEQLFARLRQGEFVRGKKGAGGGYVLSRPAEAINMAQIVAAVENGDTKPSPTAPGNEMWEQLGAELQGLLATITLADLVKQSSAFAQRVVRGRSTK